VVPCSSGPRGDDGVSDETVAADGEVSPYRVRGRTPPPVHRPAQAQTITGTVLDGGTGAPIPAAVITLLTEPGEVATRVEADSLGAFSATAPRAGSYYLRAERIGYRAVTEGIFDLGAGGTMEVQINLLTQPVELEGVEATVQGTDWVEVRQTQRLEAQGFFERMDAGFGDFFPPDSIERKQVPYVTDFVTHLPGVVSEGGILKFGSGECLPNIWIDGILVIGALRAFSNDELNSLNGRISPEQVAAIEVYRTIGGTPLQYSGMGVRCGTVLIWTKG